MKLTDDQKFKLGTTARKIVEEGRGILAADEKASSLNRRFEICGINNTEENRCKFRELLFKTKEIEGKIGGVILNEETFADCDAEGTKLVDILVNRNITVGVKLDKGLCDFKDNEKVSLGLEDLDHRCKQEKFSKVEFGKWRALFMVSDNTPTNECILENCSILAEYAEIAQKNTIVPIIEPEIFWEGDFNAERAATAQKQILSQLILDLNLRNVYMPGILIKTSFVTSGKMSDDNQTSKSVGFLTFDVLLSTIPCAVPGIVFLSGGHTPEDATLYLKRVNDEKGKHTFQLSFSFGRALTDPVLSAWLGKDENIPKAQEAFLKRIKECHSAITKNK